MQLIIMSEARLNTRAVDRGAFCHTLEVTRSADITYTLHFVAFLPLKLEVWSRSHSVYGTRS
jgi:hypothetical protein